MDNNKVINIPSNHYGYWINKKGCKDPMTVVIEAFANFYSSRKKKDMVLRVKNFVLIDYPKTLGWKCHLIETKVIKYGHNSK